MLLFLRVVNEKNLEKHQNFNAFNFFLTVCINDGMGQHSNILQKNFFALFFTHPIFFNRCPSTFNCIRFAICWSMYYGWLHCNRQGIVISPHISCWANVFLFFCQIFLVIINSILIFWMLVSAVMYHW